MTPLDARREEKNPFLCPVTFSNWGLENSGDKDTLR